MTMTRIILRVMGGVMGLIAMLLAIFLPLSFISNKMQEMESAKQYNGHASLWGAIGGSLTVLIFAAFSALISYFLLRYALRGNQPN
jgi:ABC-type Fe3+ transport system permease subunit